MTAQLGALQEDPALLLPEKGREIRSFRLTLIRDMGQNRAAGRGSFIDSALGSTRAFYRDVLQNLTTWKARAPRLREVTAVPIAPDAEVPVQIEEGLEQAQAEQPEP